ncbi:MAG: beta-ketoacyl-ACP synthase II [Bacteroidaceae bacterium]|nr:beta-ketoacyl-ACP synthase II [Bacteroidaceae bacterium]
MELKRVVVTGLGAITPLGNDIPTFWNNCVNGVSGASPITKFNTDSTKTKFACQIKDFNFEEYVDRKEARKLDAFSQYAFAAAREAILDAGIEQLSDTDKDRTGVVLGVGFCGLDTFQTEVEGLHDQKKQGFELKVTPFFIPKIIGNIAAGNIAIKNGFMGPSYTTAAACASGNNAIIDAINLIRLGQADIMLTGGSEAVVIECAISGFNAMHAISTRNDSPQTASRPLSASRDGFVMGEGAGILVLEELDHALARGAKIYAEVGGWGLSSDAYHITAPDPEGKGAAKVMKNALKDAGMKPEDIDYVNLHGTSTPMGDIAECKAIREVFGEHIYNMNLSATKSMTGHLLGAAGAIEGIICVLAIQNNIVPPTINHAEDDVDPNIDYKVNYTFNQAQKREIKAAISNAFGFGGHNACLLFKKYQG